MSNKTMDDIKNGKGLPPLSSECAYVDLPCENQYETIDERLLLLQKIAVEVKTLMRTAEENNRKIKYLVDQIGFIVDVIREKNMGEG